MNGSPIGPNWSTLIFIPLIRLQILSLLLLIVHLANGQDSPSGSKDMFLPIKKGKILYYERDDGGGKYNVERLNLGKNKALGGRAMFIETSKVKGAISIDTIKFYELTSIANKGKYTYPNGPKGRIAGWAGYIPSNLDTLQYKSEHLILKSRVQFKPYVMVGANRFDNVLWVRTNIISRHRLPGSGFKDVVVETKEWFYASGIGLIARVDSDADDNILYSLTLSHPGKGKWIEHHENGTVSHKMRYKKGERHGKYESWHSEGYKKETLKYVHGNLHKKQVQYYQTGLKKSVHVYEHGELKALFMWYKNKTLSQTGFYKDGKRNGSWLKWDDKGKENGKATYELGKVVDGYWPMPTD